MPLNTAWPVTSASAIEANDRFALRGDVDTQRQFQPLFRRAQRIAEGDNPGREANRQFARETLDRWPVPAPASEDAAN